MALRVLGAQIGFISPLRARIVWSKSEIRGPGESSLNSLGGMPGTDPCVLTLSAAARSVYYSLSQRTRVYVANTTTYKTIRTHTFYSEIVDTDFHDGGTGLWVANRDEKFRGTMEHERKGYRQSFGWEFLNKNAK